MTIPWRAAAALQWRMDPHVYFGSLDQCCVKLEAVGNQERDGARIMCNSAIKIDGESWASHNVSGPRLQLLIDRHQRRLQLIEMGKAVDQ
ncbi:hypothetical protein KFK14_19480 [Sphingobium phenoxybenzoativorans]|uniref:Uncharacterized protein n=1 Tax=Sphingobium phenoxybenzoativorans TaxID=1592790 RepID=A0A975Q187_9SPHN|nr:hypothetical protein [Sphingobium phenoxybenzoativorans]QUT05158.1 hypothetical protein KFK14_19480 [Sphingobium phenoxybenzoativorans]